MRYFIAVLVLAAPAFAQFGLGSIKDKLDGAKSKAAPVTDRAQKAQDTFTPWTPEEEQEIGKSGAAKLVSIFGLVNDPALEKYVNLVGLTVAEFASRQLPWRFGILDTNIVGAYTLPGGYVFVTRGSLAGMTNEAQLAGVLGHEIEHAAARHLESEIRGKKTSAWATQEAMAKTGGPAELKEKATAMLNDLFNTKLSRGKEDDADDQGSRMAAKAGYAGTGLSEFLRVAATASEEPQNKRLFGQVLSTHPPFQSRVDHLLTLDSAREKGKTLEARFHKELGR
jgi:beta-barrel assembly-enhancing protease